VSDVALGATAEALDTPLPYSAGPLSRFLGWVERPPAWRAWAIIAAVTLVFVAWAHVVLWATGVLAPGSIDLGLVILVFYVPYPLAAGVVGRQILRTSLATFWPATGWSETGQPSWRYRFLNVPLQHELSALVVGVPVGIAATMAAPAGVLGPESARFEADLAFGPMFVSGYVLTLISAVTVFHWLRLVAEIHRDATAIDPFDRGPIYAFSRFTVFIGLAIVVGTYYTVTVNAPFLAGNVPAQSLLPFTSVLGAAAFVVPLWGIHGRLVRKKDELMRDVSHQIRTAGAALKTQVEAGSFDESKPIHDALAGLAIVRDQVRELPTWPWPPQLLRGFISALLIPVIVYLLSRAAAGFVSL
jgi:hypothetical protein